MQKFNGNPLFPITGVFILCLSLILAAPEVSFSDPEKEFVKPPNEDLVIDFVAFNDHWTYSHKEWFFYLHNQTDQKDLIGNFTGDFGPSSGFDWKGLEDLTGVWIHVHQDIPPILNPSPPSLTYFSQAGTSEYHHLLIKYRICGNGFILIQPGNTKIKQNHGFPCNLQFDYDFVPISSHATNGTRTFSLTLNTTKASDQDPNPIILIDQVIAFGDYHAVTLPPDANFTAPARTTIQTPDSTATEEDANDDCTSSYSATSSTSPAVTMSTTPNPETSTQPWTGSSSDHTEPEASTSEQLTTQAPVTRTTTEEFDDTTVTTFSTEGTTITEPVTTTTSAEPEESSTTAGSSKFSLNYLFLAFVATLAVERRLKITAN